MNLKSAKRAVIAAMAGAGAVTAQFVSGKAVRDALFLTSHDIAALPTMLLATSVCSILLVVGNARASRRVRPAVWVPALYVASGLIFLIEWALRARAPLGTAVLVYLHVSAAGPILASGFWLIASERFDPHTAKKRYGHIAAAGTLGGLLSALATERVAAVFGIPAMLPVLAILQFVCAWLVRETVAASLEHKSPAAEDADENRESALSVLAAAPQLRNLAGLVLLGTTGAALVDYLFKAQAIESFGRGDNLLRFFSLYYAATSLLAFALQTSMSRKVLERFGLAVSAGTPAGALLAGSVVSLFAPGLASLLVARASESVFRSSFFRAGYELFYTPIPAHEKRAAKTLIDVGFDRLGDGVGGGLVRLAALAVPASQSPAILTLAILCAIGALAAASRLTRGYLGTLENSLFDLSRRAGMADATVESTTIIRTQSPRLLRGPATGSVPAAPAEVVVRGIDPASLEPELRDVLSLRSRDRERVTAVLCREEGLSAGLIPHAITLLAWDQVAEHALFALRKVAEEHIGQLVDALLDPNQDFAIRRRLARVFSVCVSQRAASGLMFGLEDPRFDVRYQSARSLSEIVEKNPLVQIDAGQIYAVVLREAAVSRGVWESRRLLEAVQEPGSLSTTLDQVVRTRAGESLAHVFRLLSLVLPREPLQIAFRGLHTDDEQLQGTALEYLESVLPAPIRQRLWPFIDQPSIKRSPRPREEVMAELLRSHHSIMLNLEELRQAKAVRAGARAS
jgi:ATP:ADP antiporter, AAA family